MFTENNFLVYSILCLVIMNEKNGINARTDMMLGCTIPNQNEKGACIEKHLCPQYKTLFQMRPFTTALASFLHSLQCDPPSSYGDLHEETTQIFVCCPLNNGTYSNPAIVMGQHARRKIRMPIITSEQNRPVDLSVRFGSDESDDNNLLPDNLLCGKSFENRIVGGEIANIDEFPWMALLLYKNKSASYTEFHCGGTLISRRYVLTAAHCVTGKDLLEQKGELRYVRLGEYKTDDDIDCILEKETMQWDCAPAPIDYEIEEIIPHPMYNPIEFNKYNDIALIRLKEDVNFTDFIQPICLPTEDFQMATMPGTLLSICGWGKTERFNNLSGFAASTVKLKLKLPVVDMETCMQAFQPQHLIIGPNQICAGGKKMQDSCPGDSGGPLMYFDRKKLLRWTVTGVVSLGLSTCGTEGVPGVYTNVPKYMSWIKSTIRP